MDKVELSGKHGLAKETADALGGLTFGMLGLIAGTSLAAGTLFIPGATSLQGITNQAQLIGVICCLAAAVPGEMLGVHAFSALWPDHPPAASSAPPASGR